MLCLTCRGGYTTTHSSSSFRVARGRQKAKMGKKEAVLTKTQMFTLSTLKFGILQS